MPDGDYIPKEGRFRLRLSIRPNSYHQLERVSEALDMELTTVATLAYAMGLRVLAAMTSTNPEINQLAADQAGKEAIGAFADADITPKNVS